MKIITDLLNKVHQTLDEHGNFQANNFINSAIVLGFHPMELNHWMNLKSIGGWTPDGDIWSRKYNQDEIEKYLNPVIPLTFKNDLPKAVLQMIKDLPNQVNEIDE